MAEPAARGRGAAYFDVDGTLVRGNIVRYYVHLRTRGLGPVGRLLWTAAYLPRVLEWLVLDRIDRVAMNRRFYRGYAGMPAGATRRAARDDYRELVGRHVHAAARRRVAEHKERGEPVVLLTGSLDFVVAPLADELGADEVLAVRMEERDGRLTGTLAGEPLAGAAKGHAVRAHAVRAGIDLAASWAYGDSTADVPVLEAVGRAVAVNPGRRLRRLAEARGWEVARWE